MKEIKCPNCGAVIPVDDADFAAIISQVRNEEFDAEVGRRVSEFRKLQQAEEASRKTEAEANHRAAISAKNEEIAILKGKIEAQQKALEREAERARLQAEAAQKDALSAKDQEIASLKEKLSGMETNKGLELENALAKARENAATALRKKEEELSARQEAFNREKEALEGQVEYYKNFKSKRSVKLLGEDLEQHCYNLYVQTLAPVLTDATFEKDNEAVREEGETKGTKGDFILRARRGDVEYLSVMFEMKNEGEESSTKHRNADFFDKLDKDRRKKSCDYAVLVSMLEMDNDLYNGGIVAVPGYEKMYVVRPDNFITIINLLVQTSRKSIDALVALDQAKKERVDVTNFEEDLGKLKDSFFKSLGYAKDRYSDAIKGIDATIKKLQDIRDTLSTSVNHLDTANNKLQGIDIKKLTDGNETMTKAFDEARAKKDAERKAEEPEEQ